MVCYFYRNDRMDPCDTPLHIRDFEMKPYPKPTRPPKGNKKTVPLRKRLEAEIERLSRELVWWRDGGRCVLAEIDGGRCGGPIQWGHFIPRSRSAYLKFAVGNTFCQCGNHNLLHKNGDEVFSVWYSMFFGQRAHAAIWNEARSHKGKPQTWELEDWIKDHQDLLDDRPSTYTRPMLIERGFYGTWPQG